MIYTLMNKNAELFDIEITNGNIRKIENFREENKKLLPAFLINMQDNKIGIDSVIKWWQSRRIPASRDGIKELLLSLSNISLDELAEKSLGLSLSDQYWLRELHNMKKIKWEDVNFFQNDFSEDIGDLLINGDWNGGSLMSPDNSSDGAVKKRWKMIGNDRYLIKGSSDPFFQTEPFREVFASRIAELLLSGDSNNFSDFSNFYVQYDFIWDENNRTGKKIYSSCKNFVTVDTEYVPFTHFREIESTLYKPEHFEICRKIYGKYKYILDIMLILDYIVLNEDRHFGNFGMIRNANTGEFIKPAPIFDTSASLFHNSVIINPIAARAKPFSKNFEEQIKLIKVSDYRKNILLLKENVKQIFWDTFDNAFEDKERLSAILRVIKLQIDKLLDITMD